VPQNHWKNFSSFGNRIDLTNKLNADLDAVELITQTSPCSAPIGPIHLQQGGNSFFLTTFVLQHWFPSQVYQQIAISNKLVIGLTKSSNALEKRFFKSALTTGINSTHKTSVPKLKIDVVFCKIVKN
jgi:hypothetical protein